ncbi:MAG: NAD(P)/FAD-dependent oxidoreductase [Bacteroidales bacterium]
MRRYDVIVIGAGPAGLLAAGRAAEKGASVLLLEKMRQEGRKLLITGKGRCNITNSAEVGDFLKHVHPHGRFLKSAFIQFYNDDIIDLLNRYGVETVLERGGRYFPSTGRSGDVLDALLKWVHEEGVEIRCGVRVEKILVRDGRIEGVRTGSGNLLASRVVLATGGRSYPATGSDGDGYRMAREVGHTVVKTRPALVPLVTAGKVPAGLHNLILKNVNVVLWLDGKKAAEEFGEMAFTDFGLSGPVILTLSKRVVDALEEGREVKVAIDLKPALDEKKLDRRLLRDLDENGKKELGTVFRKWLPASMVPVFIELLEIDPKKMCHQVASSERKRIRYLLKNLAFSIHKYRSFKEAVITAGGIPTTEINSGTMESKVLSGLYFAGEIIDLDADTGGYNLQIAYSTGWLAGETSYTNL